MKIILMSEALPPTPGLYLVRQWYTYRILEWHEGAWWHEGKVSRWPSKTPTDTGIDAWLGPLPKISKDYTKPPLGVARAPEPEYDL